MGTKAPVQHENEADTPCGCAQARRVILVDDHPLVRRGLIEAAQAECPDLVIEEAGTLAELLKALGQSQDVALVLLDLHLPDCMDLAGLRIMRERFPAVPVAIISAIEDDVTVAAAVRLGAMGFIPKSARTNVLADALRNILAGEIWTPSTSGAAARPSPQPQHNRIAEAGLTPAQMRIISGLQRGLLNKQIAFEIGVTEHTVKAHMTAAFRKLGVENRLQAMVLLRSERVAIS